MEKESRKAECLIELKNFTFAYGKKLIFENVNLTIDTAQIFGILGDNGAGKTSLFDIISRNTDINKEGQLLPQPKDIAFLQASPYFYPYMTGIEYLKIVSQYAEEKLSLWNSIFHLPLKEYIHTYSTGMQKKLSIIGMLLLDKKIIIMDEPFNGLDIKSSEILHIIMERLKETGCTILLSSHSLETIFQHADQVVLIKDKQFSKNFDRSQFGDLTRIIKGEFIGNVRGKIDKLIFERGEDLSFFSCVNCF